MSTTSDEEEMDSGPTYSVKELSDIFIDFYKFLSTLHYDPSDLKIPPPEGWPLSTLPAALVEKKTAGAVEVMRHLPYFRPNQSSTHLDYKCLMLDYTDPELHQTAVDQNELFFEFNEPLEDSDGNPVDPDDFLVIAWGYESGGHYYALDTQRGEITVDVVRCQLQSPEDVVRCFEELKARYRSMDLLPCPGRETMAGVEEDGELIKEEDVLAQEEEWGTHLDWSFVQQIYRQHGWPDAFRREEAVKAVEDFMELKEDERGVWEGSYN